MNNRLVVPAAELESVIKLGGAKRYEYFVKRVADWEQAWSLWDEGWAMMADNEGMALLPLWPASEFASICATDVWSAYKSVEISLDALLDELLPRLEQDKVRLAVFPLPESKGVIVSPDQLRISIETECENYE